MENENKINSPESNQESNKKNIGRREVLKTLVTVPVLGAVAYGALKTRRMKLANRDISDVFNLSNASAVYLQPQANGKQIRIGLVGFGIRGKQLMRGLGFAEPSYIDTLIDAKAKNPDDTRIDEFSQQDNLHEVINDVCEVVDVFS